MIIELGKLIILGSCKEAKIVFREKEQPHYVGEGEFGSFLLLDNVLVSVFAET